MKEQINVIAYLKENNETRRINKAIFYDTVDFVGVLNIDIPKNITEIYIQFDSIVILKNLEITSNEGKLDYKNLNGISLKNLDLFINEKPKIAIELENKEIEYLRLQTEIYKFTREHVGVLSDFIDFIQNYNCIKEKELNMEKELSELVLYKEKYLDISKKNEENENKLNELIPYKEKYLDVSKKNEENENKLLVLKEQYDCVVNSKCWKITKPVRVCLDILKHNKLVSLIFNKKK